MISDEEVEAALDYLRDSAPSAAKARAERIYVEQYRDALLAILMKTFKDETSVAAQEREAKASDKYLAHLDAIREAVEIDEKNRFLREGARAKIEAWQTFSANIRGMKV